MYPERTNLLPPARQQQLRRDYFYRLAAVAALVGTFLVAIHGALLYPAYHYLEQEIATRTTDLASLQASLASSDEQELDTRLAMLSEETNALGALATSTPLSSTLAEILALAHPGVRITGIALANAQGSTAPEDSISGTADTRDDLRAYYLALSGAPFVGSANLPVSAYASAANIPFTITLVFATPSP
jgi:Tfp pilus assembly protein PilN